jgi:glycosyltransferase involved in cell wall biosynthesis
VSPLRILLLLPFAPRIDAPHGGGRSTAEIVAGLAARHRVAVLCLRRDGDPPSEKALRARCELLEEFDQAPVGATAAARMRRRIRLATALAGGRPMWVADSDVAGLRERVRTLAREWRPDVVQAEFHVMAQYLAAASPRRVGLVTEHEVGRAAAVDRARSERGWERVLYRLDALAWRRYERRALRAADRVIVFTNEDASRLAGIVDESSIVVVPLGTTISPKPLAAAGTEPAIVFVGNYMHPPNVEAALRLTKAVVPLVREQRPDAKLYLVGPNPTRAMLAAGDGVEATGYVDDVAPFLDRAAVVCMPISSGGGVRVKLLEALAAGKAVVATARAVEGVRVRDRVDVVLAESDEELAARLLEVIEDQALRVELARNARALAERDLGWEHTVAAYERIYAELLSESRPRVA